MSDRASRDASWSVPINVTSLNSAVIDRVSYIANDRSVIGMSSNRNGDDDLFIARFDPAPEQDP